MPRNRDDQSRHNRRVQQLVDGPLHDQGISCIDPGHYNPDQFRNCDDEQWDHTPDIYIRRQRPGASSDKGIIHEVETESSVGDSHTKDEIQSWLPLSQIDKVVIHIPSPAVNAMAKNVDVWRGRHRNIEIRDWSNQVQWTP